MPRSVCGRWSPGLILLHNLSDALTGLSYFTIPAILFYFIRRRLDVPFRPIFWLFGAFILACGLTHILEIVVFYRPVYRLIGLVKLITGLISAATVIALAWTIPHALALRGMQALERELEARRQAEEAATMRTRQLENLVELSRRALSMGEPDILAEEVAVLAARGLGVRLCGIFRAIPERAELQLLAGVGWSPGLVGSTTIPAGIGSLAGFVAREAGQVVSEDLRCDTRFDITRLERQHEAIGGMGVEIQGSDGPHGILVAYTTHPQRFVLTAHVPRRIFRDDEVWFLRSVAALLGSNLSRIEAERALKTLASTDGLTGLHNARHLREVMPTMGSQAARAGDRLSALMLDIDRFKAYNDTYGHPGGDEVLCQVGAILQREARQDDLVARYGGEEFALVLPGTGADEAKAFAERIRRAIADHPWPYRAVTASIGVATAVPGGPDGLPLLAEADQALYLAKRTGRDRVVHHNDISDRAGSCLDIPPVIEPVGPDDDRPVGSTLLHIDDDRSYRRALGRHLAAGELGVIGADTAAEGLRRAADRPDLILLDVRLPDGNGFDICRRLKADPNTAMTPILLLSSTLIHGEQRAKALAAGASAALPKTSEHEELMAVIAALLRARRSERELIRARYGMSERLREQAAELGRLCDATIEGWARALELRDHETEGHSRRVAELTTLVARQIGLDGIDLLHIWRGALLHDIGKVGVPDAILNKPAPLDATEWLIMRRHPELAFNLLRPIEFLRPALDIPLRHHERWDGTGYPDGLEGEQIPLSARIFAAVDIFDALSHARPYREAWSADRVREHLRALAGSHLDPAVTLAILDVIR